MLAEQPRPARDPAGDPEQRRRAWASWPRTWPTTAASSVPELSADLSARLGRHVLGTVGTTNPVDAGAGATSDDLSATAGLLLESDEVDALVVVLVATGVSDATEAVRALVAARAGRPDKPMLLVPLGGVRLPEDGVPGITCLDSVDGAVRALSRIATYEAWRRVPRDATPPLRPGPQRQPVPGDGARGCSTSGGRASSGRRTWPTCWAATG